MDALDPIDGHEEEDDVAVEATDFALFIWSAEAGMDIWVSDTWDEQEAEDGERRIGTGETGASLGESKSEYTHISSAVVHSSARREQGSGKPGRARGNLLVTAVFPISLAPACAHPNMATRCQPPIPLGTLDSHWAPTGRNQNAVLLSDPLINKIGISVS